MPFWQIYTTKTITLQTKIRYFSVNVYYTEAPTYQDAWVVAHECLNAERFILTAESSYLQTHSVGVHDMSVDPRYWYIDDATGVGSWVSDGAPLNVVGPIVRVRGLGPDGREARKYYRVGVDNALMSEGPGNASFAAAFSQFAAAFEGVRPLLYRPDGTPYPSLTSWEVGLLKARHGTIRWEEYPYR